MPLFLVRHAHAVSESEDRQRPLSERGIAQIRTLVSFFQTNHQFTPVYAWHSPLLRARQTAEMLLSGLNSDAALIETSGLMPEDDPLETANRLAAISSSLNIAIVGHQPHLGGLVSVLLGQRGTINGLNPKKASILALDRTPAAPKKGEKASWELLWLVTADLLTPRPVAPPTALPWPR